MNDRRLFSLFTHSNRRRNSRVTGSPSNNVIRHGISSFTRSDIYHFLLTLSWWQFLVLFCLVFLGINLIFACLFYLGGDCLKNARRQNFLDFFFFSVHTIATVGYGSIYPQTEYANWVATFESIVGIVGTATVTGLVFARFSLPTARVLFSNVAVICP